MRDEVDSAEQLKPDRPQGRPPFERIALLLQGGGALGAYQAGVYQGLAEAGLHPDWTAGISIGAINAALIAGNSPEQRVEKLRLFWERVTSPGPPGFDDELAGLLMGDAVRVLLNQWSAGQALCRGAPGFFAPRPLAPWLLPGALAQATSFYDTGPLKETLGQLVDFDRINSGAMRFSVGAVNVRTGALVYFDSTTHCIRPEHVMASGALPPGFPAIEVDGEYYWDGGLVSNTPLRWVVDNEPHQDTLAFQVDLWSTPGEMPRNMTQVATRQKELLFSSRTRAESNRFREIQVLRAALSSLIRKLPDNLASSPEAAALQRVADPKVWSLVQFTYRPKEYEGDAKDFDFSRKSMEEHWRTGYEDTVRALRHPEALKRPHSLDGVRIFDLAEQRSE